jgi:hypothetical protein
MQTFESNHPCNCIADITRETAVQAVKRGKPPTFRHAKQIFHIRHSDGARFWHWSDQDVVVV